MSKLIQTIPALLLLLACTPGAYADIPPPQAEAVPASFGIAGILCAVAIVLAGLWIVTRMKRIGKEKELLAAGGSLSSATEAGKAKALK